MFFKSPRPGERLWADLSQTKKSALTTSARSTASDRCIASPEAAWALEERRGRGPQARARGVDAGACGAKADDDTANVDARRPTRRAKVCGTRKPALGALYARRKQAKDCVTKESLQVLASPCKSPRSPCKSLQLPRTEAGLQSRVRRCPPRAYWPPDVTQRRFTNLPTTLTHGLVGERRRAAFRRPGARRYGR